MSIRCVLVDDEQPARDELRYLLSSYDDVEIIGEADSARKAVALVEQSVPDVVFLDIQMPGQSGFDVVQQLGGMRKMPLVVFVTAYDNYAVKAFELSAVDYIMKPLSEQRLYQTLQRVRQQLGDEGGAGVGLETKLQALLVQMGTTKDVVKVSVEKNGRIHLLAPVDIVYCSYELGKIMVYSNEGPLPLYGIATMDKLAEHLVGYSFFRTHRAVLVNLDCILEFSPWFNGKYNLVMNDDKHSELAVSRTRVKAFKQRLGI